MARLLIGHVTDTTARIWVRGTQDCPVAFVDLLDSKDRVVESRSARLEERHFYTGILDFEGLSPRRVYHARARFGAGSTTPPESRERPDDCEGRLRTFPATGSSAPLSFLFGSCNLHSLGSINPSDPAYERLGKQALEKSADFMLHCGDQIYYDRPRANRPASVGAYRKAYLDAWNDSRKTRQFLTQLPHYMILDDHEIRNNFRNDMEVRNGSIDTLKDFSLKAYREFQHIHNPNTFGHDCLYYTFDFGMVRFFVMDTRTERWGDGQSEMIGHQQMSRLLDWLAEHRGDVKFVVTSVPFTTEIPNTDEKWCSEPYRHQRHQILEHITSQGIRGVVFLTGDMHNSYHAEMTLRRGGDAGVVHELMSSPINQLGKQSRSRYSTDQVQGLSNGWSYSTGFAGNGGGDEFFTGHSNAMHVRVEGRSVEYTVFRTKQREEVLKGAFTV